MIRSRPLSLLPRLRLAPQSRLCLSSSGALAFTPLASIVRAPLHAARYYPLSSLRFARAFSSAPPPAGSGVLSWVREQKAKLLALAKEYGYFSVATYFGVYLATLSVVYGLVVAGAVPAFDVNEFMNSLTLKKWMLGPEPIVMPRWGLDFMTAWVITKTTEPARVLVTIALVPFLAKRLPNALLAAFGVRLRPAASAGGAPAAGKAALGGEKKI
jgi:hypothetical protein